ncbi:hypothetical protein EDI_213800 [Entamoeba dispar SAW760]|uniref:Uncharacterized protein n=1 Tax=Entamoeba dispar (strain ATCC PRA-260 / SAW760) TaxID=370354 RepID=B0E857_ENTDS|nr:uncharacterized protein EDI_213800 [Entamoeba dispar SAW760]EDR29305.1 hypothetical protein EDI_213800 [Entamoeba dispar SAW760]|eukprot:EDR29305.1 hypothetical protein EDI_213800 [Entamoeba dispar SAW760]
MERPCNTPVFNEVDSTPIPPEIPEEEEYHLKLCLCPLCKHGMEVFGVKRPVSWILICRVILYSLMELHKGTVYFSLKDDIHGFVAAHWHIFGQLDQFKTNPNRWKKAFLDGLSHSPFFQSGTLTLKRPNFWKLRRKDCPWVKQKKSSLVEENDDQGIKEAKEEIQQQNSFFQAIGDSPMLEFNGIPTRDNAKEFLKTSVENTKNQLDKCQIICQNLSKDPQLNQNMKMINDQLNWIHNSLNVISANIETTLF